MPATADPPTALSHLERTLIDLQELQHCRAGAVLFCEGTAAIGIYIVHSGAVDLVFAARNGTSKPLQLAGPGQVLALSSVVSQRPHDSTAIVRMPSELGYVDGKKLMAVLEHDPAAWLEVLQLLSQDVSACWDSMRRISSHPR